MLCGSCKIVAQPATSSTAAASRSSTRSARSHTALTLGDGQSVTAWDVEVHGPQADEFTDASGRFYRLEDARRVPAAQLDRGPPRLPQHQDLHAAPGSLSHPEVDHCGNCGTIVAIGGWMIASLGLSRPDCYE
ncbi:hypothetical protein OG592_41110 (plasmid) [Streptomyces avidinii]|uniref:hypothetical protein n=1 Tax=Streptomyces avidinii TaxID=1895 RepID=UPI0038705876|nr:hypothetical protein OG592_41110 [Streptomyces avidinii]